VTKLGLLPPSHCSPTLIFFFFRDDPSQRRPDIRVAERELGWKPRVTVREGLGKTVEYFRRELEETGKGIHERDCGKKLCTVLTMVVVCGVASLGDRRDYPHGARCCQAQAPQLTVPVEADARRPPMWKMMRPPWSGSEGSGWVVGGSV
jgi:hypothetical protein